MIPRFYSTTPVQYRSPQTAMVAAAEEARAGQSAAQMGAQISAWGTREMGREDRLSVSRGWAQFDETIRDYLRQIPERRKELRQTRVDPVSGSTITGYQAEIDKFPDFLQEQLGKVGAGLSRTAKEALEERYNTHKPQLADYVAKTLSHLELEDVTSEILDHAKADRLADAMELFELYQDRYSPNDRQRIQAQIDDAVARTRLATAATFLQDMAAEEGWDETAQLIADPNWQKALGLDIGESAQNLRTLETFVAAQAGRAAREQKFGIEQAKTRLFADALADQPVDPAEIDAAIRSGVVSTAEGKQLYELVRKGPAAENDVETMIAARRMIDGIERGTVTSEQTVAFLRANVSRLKPETLATLTKEATDVWSFQARAVANVRRFAVTQLVSGDDDLLDRLRMLGAGKDILTPLEARRKQEYRLVEYVETQLRDWMAQNPQATYEEAAARGRQWIDQVQQLDQMQRQNLLDAWKRPSEPSPLRADTPPAIRQLVTDALDAGIPLDEILRDPEVAPYVER